MKKYVLVFLFTGDLRNVWLIKKERPEWQKGLLNGIGGKIEDEDFSEREAAERELREEAGVYADLIHVGVMAGRNNDESDFTVDVFTGITDEALEGKEDEEIDIYSLYDIRNRTTYPTIDNVPALLELCLLRLNGSSHFSGFVLDYTEEKKGVEPHFKAMTDLCYFMPANLNRDKPIIGFKSIDPGSA